MFNVNLLAVNKSNALWNSVGEEIQEVISMVERYVFFSIHITWGIALTASKTQQVLLL